LKAEESVGFSVSDLSAKIAIPQRQRKRLLEIAITDQFRLITMERIMGDRLNRKQFTRLTVMALSLMLIIIGVVFMGLHYFSHWLERG
jgi:hypothetical protein